MIGFKKVKRRFSLAFNKKLNNNTSPNYLKSLSEEDPISIMTFSKNSLNNDINNNKMTNGADESKLKINGYFKKRPLSMVKLSNNYVADDGVKMDIAYNGTLSDSFQSALELNGNSEIMNCDQICDKICYVSSSNSSIPPCSNDSNINSTYETHTELKNNIPNVKSVIKNKESSSNSTPNYVYNVKNIDTLTLNGVKRCSDKMIKKLTSQGRFRKNNNNNNINNAHCALPPTNSTFCGESNFNHIKSSHFTLINIEENHKPSLNNVYYVNGINGNVNYKRKESNRKKYSKQSQTGGMYNGQNMVINGENCKLTVNGTEAKALSQEEISKRLSLPIDIHIPESFLTRNFSQPLLNGPLSRKDRRDSLYEIGFGRSDTYTKLDKVGEGTYATVYRGRSRLTDSFVALKEIRLEYEEGAPCTAIREVSLLKNLKHANIVTLHDIVHTKTSLTLVFEYLERDLKQYMEDCDNILHFHNVKLFLFQLFRGLEFCHRKQILHRDLKPQNLLINKVGELKLADFGLARAKSVPTKTFSNEVVTLWYRPPEVLLGSTEYSTPIDMWGVGCIFYEMACGKPLFPGSTVEDQLKVIWQTLGPPANNTYDKNNILCHKTNQNHHIYNKNIGENLYFDNLRLLAPRLDKSGIDLLSRLLEYDPKLRISAKIALRHEFFKSLPERVHHLPDTTSIFTVPNIKLMKDPGFRPINAKQRRQSLL